MIRKSFRIGLKLGLLAAVAAVVVKVVKSRQVPAVVPRPAPAGSRPSWPPVTPEPAREAAPEPTAEPEPEPEPTPEPPPAPSPAPSPAEADPPARTRVRPLKAVRTTTPPDPAGGGRWIEPNGDVCPSTHPIKAKLSSKIYHLVGGRSYDRTNPDRCYATAADAEADGLRAAKR